jgi:hypothetical protein
MELLTIVIALFGSLIAFGLLAVNKGVDSREGIGDDWNRRVIA